MNLKSKIKKEFENLNLMIILVLFFSVIITTTVVYAVGNTDVSTPDEAVRDTTYTTTDCIKPTMVDITDAPTTFLETTTEATTEVITDPPTTEQPTEIVVESADCTDPPEPVEEYGYNEDILWDGEVLNASNGTVNGPSGKETYYNLDMSGVVNIMRGIGNTDEYWIREDGCKMLGDYIMCAADLDVRPRGSLVESSLGTCIVCDTGSFVYSDSYQLDIAVNW